MVSRALKESIDDPRGCTVYPFAYLHADSGEKPASGLEPPWELRPTADDDIRHLEGFLAQGPGKLLTEAFHLGSPDGPRNDLPAEYRRLGFRLDRHLFSLFRDGHLKAMFLVDLTDVGLNLADLTSSIKAFILDDRNLNQQVFQAATAAILGRFDRPQMPVLVYPDAFAKQEKLPVEKLYHLWLLNLDHLDQYFRYCSRFLTELQKEGDELS